MALNVARCDPLPQEVRKLPFFVVTGYYGHTLDTGHFAWLELCIAACDQDCRLGIAPVEGTDCLSAFFVGEFRDAACVDNYDIGFLPGGDAPDAFVGKGAGNRRGLGKVQFAPEGVEHCFEGAECRVVNHKGYPEL